MSYTKEMLEKNRVKFTVEVDEADWKAAIEEAYNKNKSKFQIGGFRKGKVPRKVIEAQYGVGVFFDDALDTILPKTYGAILDEEKELFPVDMPKIDIIAISDSTLKYSATVQLKPDVELGQYTGLEFKKDKVKVTNEESQKEIDKALDAAGAWESVTDRPVQNGDKTVIDYSGSVDGVKFEGGTAEKQPLEIGSGMFIPGFEEQVIGMNIGDEKDIVVTFPENYGATELAGKEAVFKVKLHEITVKTTPAYDDEFVKDVSEFDTVAQYEADIKKNLKESKEKDAEMKLENDIIEKIASLSEVDIPKCMIDQQAEEMVQEFEYRLMYQGLNKDDYYKFTGTTKEELMEKYSDTAKKNVLFRLVLEAILKEVKIVVSDEEVNEQIADMANKAGKSVEEYSKLINEEYRNYIRNDVITTKLFTYLKNNNTIK